MSIDLSRGELFELSALDYDRFRPGYPNTLVNEIVSLSNLQSSSRLLEIGCGTGKATVPFASRGYMIDCIDPGKKLLEFARRNCGSWPNVTFKAGKFEDVAFGANRYDLIFSAQAFHWVDPMIRLQKAAMLLKENGSLALLHNYPGKMTDRIVKNISAAVLEESNGKMKSWDYFEDLINWKNEIESCGLFGEPNIVRYRWTKQYDGESYAGLFRTYSDYLSLPESIQKRIAGRIREIINKNGGYVTRSYDSVLIHAILVDRAERDRLAR